MLKGFLWSMGRCATKAVAETISAATDAEATSWVDTAKIIEAPRYHLQLLDRPTVLTLHHPQFLNAFGKLLDDHATKPVVFTVRDPIANLESFAATFLTSFVARRVDEAAQHVAAGKSIVAAINPAALDEWLMPTSHIWRQYSALKGSPHLVVDFSELGDAQFAATMTRICDFLGLQLTSPIQWTGEANGASDRFLVGYMRSFQILDRKIELRFTRWDDYWGDPGVVTLGTLESHLLDPIIGAGGRLFVQAKSDQLLTEGRLDRERAAFAKLLADPALSDTLATQIAVDHAKTEAIVKRELPALQAQLVRQFHKTQRDGVRRFLKAHPALEDNWARWRAAQEKAAA
jgi:hypothetical protein